jgi:GNAT superfamily N-acetyltransferase
VNYLEIRLGTEADLDRLAVMNKELIEDEQSDNAMNIDQLRERMQGFISADYKVYIFEEDFKVLGYALVNFAKEPLYLRQFFITRDSRRQGYGSSAFQLLMKSIEKTVVDIDVYTWNERGMSFWRKLGFKERVRSMRYQMDNEVLEDGPVI